MATRGIREVPMELNLQDPGLRGLLVDLREQVVSLRSSQAPLAAPTNFNGNALAFAAHLVWTRVTGADFYEVLWNTTANLKTAKVQGVGDSQEWVDNVGKDAITRFYWVRARRYTGAISAPSGPIKVVTLAAGTGVTPAPPPPSGHIQVIDQSTGHTVYLPVTGRREF